MTETLELTGKVHTVEFNTHAEGSPHIEPLAGHRNVLRAHARGPVSGAVTGIITESVTEVHSVPQPEVQGIAITFAVESSDGSFSGYYTGSIEDVGEKYLINGHGQVLSVTGVYADLFLAEVFVSSEVPKEGGRAVGERGTLTLFPR